MTTSKTSRKHSRNALLAVLVLSLPLLGVAGSYLRATPTVESPIETIEQAAPSARSSELATLQTSFAPVVKRAQAAVVNISTARTVRLEPTGAPQTDDPSFLPFFGDRGPRPLERPRARRERSLGSGVIVSSDGLIITNDHVVEGATDIRVFLADKREFSAKLVGGDSKTDIAVLKVDAQGLPTLPWGDSSQAQVGDIALAIGNPFGIGQTVTMGIISAIGRGNLGIEDYEDFIQTDAAINPGNSGGALINGRGELIGINTAILSNGAQGNQGIGFAVPAKMARYVADQIQRNGTVVRGWLGVQVQDLDPKIVKVFGLADARGALVADVSAGSPAEAAGLRKGDVIRQVNGEPVVDVRSLRLRTAATAPGSKLDLRVFRDGKEQAVQVTLGTLAADKDASPAESAPAASPRARLGVAVEEITPQAARQLRLPAGVTGVVITQVLPGSPAAEAGLRGGDVIQEVNRKTIADVQSFRQAVESAGNDPVLLLVNRQGSTSFVVVDKND